MTNEDIEAIINENAVNIIANENIEAIIDFDSDSDYESDIASDYQTSLDSASESDFDEILDDLDLFFMPNVDFDVCPIEELQICFSSVAYLLDKFKNIQFLTMK